MHKPGMAQRLHANVEPCLVYALSYSFATCFTKVLQWDRSIAWNDY